MITTPLGMAFFHSNKINAMIIWGSVNKTYSITMVIDGINSDTQKYTFMRKIKIQCIKVEDWIRMKKASILEFCQV